MTTPINKPEFEIVDESNESDESGESEDFENIDEDKDDKPEKVEEQNQTGDKRKTASPLKKISKSDKTLL